MFTSIKKRINLFYTYFQICMESWYHSKENGYCPVCQWKLMNLFHTYFQICMESWYHSKENGYCPVCQWKLMNLFHTYFQICMESWYHSKENGYCPICQWKLDYSSARRAHLFHFPGHQERRVRLQLPETLWLTPEDKQERRASHREWYSREIRNTARTWGTYSYSMAQQPLKSFHRPLIRLIPIISF